MNPRAADVVRKTLGYGLAIGLTVLLFRVLGRLAGGRQALLDPELWAMLALATLAFLWVRWARKVSASRPWRDAGPPPEDPIP